jgi:hypothetical protein
MAQPLLPASWRCDCLSTTVTAAELPRSATRRTAWMNTVMVGFIDGARLHGLAYLTQPISLACSTCKAASGDFQDKCVSPAPSPALAEHSPGNHCLKGVVLRCLEQIGLVA